MVNKHLPGQHNQQKHGKHTSRSNKLNATGLETMLSDGGLDAIVLTKENANPVEGYDVIFSKTHNALEILWDHEFDPQHCLVETETRSNDTFDLIYSLIMLPKLATNSDKTEIHLSTRVPLDVVSTIWRDAVISTPLDTNKTAAGIISTALKVSDSRTNPNYYHNMRRMRRVQQICDQYHIDPNYPGLAVTQAMKIDDPNNPGHNLIETLLTDSAEGIKYYYLLTKDYF